MSGLQRVKLFDFLPQYMYAPGLIFCNGNAYARYARDLRPLARINPAVHSIKKHLDKCEFLRDMIAVDFIIVACCRWQRSLKGAFNVNVKK